MMWGHCVQYCANGDFDFFENGVFKFIYSFHMPLFMMVSGYLFFFSCKKRSLSELLIHRSQALLQPILFCTIVNYFITDVISSRKISTIISGQWLSKLGDLWFLWSVLAACVVVGIAEKITNNSFYKLLIIFLGVGVVALFPNWTMNVYMYPYFVIGFYFCKHKDKLPSAIISLKYSSLILFPILLVFYDTKHYIYTTGIISSDSIKELLMIDFYRWLIGFIGSVFALVIIELLFKLPIFKNCISKPVSALGIKSLQIYCMSTSLLSFWLPEIYNKLCSMTGSNFFASNVIIYNFIFTPLLAIVYATGIYYVVMFMEKIKISKIIFGR